MVETHAFGNFVPVNARYMILGSFTGRQAVKGTSATDGNYDWFYGTKRNQFWSILKGVYDAKFRDIREKQELFTKLGIAMADIIYQCQRKHGNNLDNNLINIVYNKAIIEILDNNPIENVFFTSKLAEKKFKKVFRQVIDNHPSIQYMTLPSPSLRYAKMSKEQKIQCYKELLPKL
jgi:hypoxanthine-DNA glycosylase